MQLTRFVCGECGERYERGGYCARDGQALAETDDALLGSDVGRYRIARLLAEGGMGRVYLGVQPTIGSRVAIKILSDQSKNADLLDRFFAEARAVNMIRHENIVSVIDMAKLDDGRPYIVMEFIEGQTLGSLVRAGGAPLGGVVQVMMEVLSALAAAHQIGIVHRDLKPDNVLVTGEGHAKVLDFGIAKLLPGLSQQLSPRTRTGALLGTPAYMAPEQISGSGQIDPRTDIYAAGIVLYEAVTGRVPFVGDTLFDLMRMHLEVAPQMPRSLRPDLPPPLEHVIMTALAKDPAQRFQTAGAMAQALQHGASTLRPEDWRALSTRRSHITGGGRTQATRMPLKPVTVSPTPGTDPISQQNTTARDTTHARRERGALPWIIGMFATAALAVLVTLLVVNRKHEPTAEPVAKTQEVPPGEPLPGGPSPTTPPTPSTMPGGPSPMTPSTTPGGPSPTTPSSTTPSRSPSTPSSPPSAPTDNRVTKGPNVTTGPNVTSGSNAAAGPITQSKHEIVVAADYDPKNFDPVAYVPKALALAQKLLPDARLTRFEFDPVASNGRVDLTQEGRDREYYFRSEAASKRPPGKPPNVPVERACMIHVELEPKHVTARIVSNDDCDDKFVRTPRCKLDAVWKQALKAGTPSDFVARIGWLQDEEWFFDTDLGNNGTGEVSSFKDRCP